MRYETDETAGISHFMERMAFKVLIIFLNLILQQTTTKRGQRELVQELEEMGGNITSSSSRELMGYSAELIREHVPRMIELIADTVINPVFDENELNEQKAVIDQEIKDIAESPSDYLPELFHGVALKGKELLLFDSERYRSSCTFYDSTKFCFGRNNIKRAQGMAQHLLSARANGLRCCW
jgi:processing peptidase subunit alpha